MSRKFTLAKRPGFGAGSFSIDFGVAKQFPAIEGRDLVGDFHANIARPVRDLAGTWPGGVTY